MSLLTQLLGPCATELEARAQFHLAIGYESSLCDYDFFEHDDEDYDDPLNCTACGGEGYAEVDDPLWDECDEFGWGPCTACRGTGERKHQWVF